MADLLRSQAISRHGRQVQLVAGAFDRVAVMPGVGAVVDRRLTRCHEHLLVVVMRQVDLLVSTVVVGLVSVRLLVGDVIQVRVAQPVVGADNSRVVLGHRRAVVVVAAAVAGCTIARVVVVLAVLVEFRGRVVGRRRVNAVLDGRRTIKMRMSRVQVTRAVCRRLDRGRRICRRIVLNHLSDVSRRRCVLRVHLMRLNVMVMMRRRSEVRITARSDVGTLESTRVRCMMISIHANVHHIDSSSTLELKPNSWRAALHFRV